MGMTNITMLHALERGEPKLSPSLETESSSLGDSSRVACSDGDPLWAMPPTTALESPPSGDGLKLLEWSVMNSRSSKWMADVLSELDVEPSRCCRWRRWVYIDEGTIGMSRGKARYKSPSWHTNCRCFCTSKNRVVEIAHSSFEMVLRTTKHTVIYPSLCSSSEVIAICPSV
jgi:hypothetical protein